MQLPPAAKARFEAYINDWCLFAREYLRVDLDVEQEAVLRSVQHNPKTSVASGTSRGKDYVAAVAAICFLYLTPRWDNGILVANTKVALTAPTGRQVKDIMTPEITRIFTRSIYLPGTLVGNDIRIHPYKEWFLTGFKADDKNTEAWTGFHAPNVLYVVTEATGLPQTVFDAIEGNLQGNSRLLIVFNHNINTGYAHASTRDPAFSKFRLNSLNAPNVTLKQIKYPGQVNYDCVKDRVRDWCIIIDKQDMSVIEGDFEWEGACYRPNDLFRSKILGLGPKASNGVLVPIEWIELANQRWADFNKKRKPIEKPLRLGLDVAGMGRDNTCSCHRYGDYVKKFELKESGGTANHMEVTGIFMNTLRANLDTYHGRYPQGFIDTIGEGAGVFSRAAEVSDEQPADKVFQGRIYSSKFSQAAKDLAGNPLKDHTEQYEFLNMRAWLYWAVRDWLDPSKGSTAMLPPDDQLAQELSETMWKFKSNGRWIMIEEKEELKKRLKRSPDKGDSLALTFWPVPDVDPRPEKRQSAAQYLSSLP
ncbi:MAG TPA: hypothetical protein VGM31_14315 [Puia sp.]